jgi:flagellin
MVVHANLAAVSASNSLALSQSRLTKSLARISSGTRIVEPGDDAAGLAESSKIDSRLHRVDGARANVSNATSFVQTQEGYLKKIANALDRMSELSVLAQDVTKTESDRALYDQEFSELKGYINSAGTKEFNGISLFTPNAIEVTVDAEGSGLRMAGIDLKASPYSLVTSSEAGVATPTLAGKALADIKSALSRISADRASIGAYQATLSYNAESLTVSKENLTAANSRIRDVNVAEESTEYSRANIIVQSGTAMLAQANQLPQTVLRLLQ